MKLIKTLTSLALIITSAGALAQSPGVSDKEILVGQFAAFSGPASQLGERLKVGIEAYFKAINAQGGVNGRTLKLVTRDDGYEPEKATAAAKALIYEDKVFAFVGAVGTPTGLAALPVITNEKVPMIGMFTGAQALREPFNRQIFHVRASYFDETERIVQHVTSMGAKNIAVFYQNDTYGKAGLEGVTRALTKRDMKPVALATFERNTVDVAASLATILPAKPDAVIQVGAYKSVAAFIKESRKKGYGGQFYNVSFVGSKALADELGPVGTGVVISQVVPFPFAQAMPIVREYQQRMGEAGEKEFDFSSMEGFLMAKVFVEGVKRAGRNLTRDALINGLETINAVNLGGFNISFSAKNHEGSKFTDLSIIGRDSKFAH